MENMNSSTLLKKGAEASLYLAEWQGRRVIIKARLPKKYRPAQLDKQIRNYRTIHEPQLMHEAKKAGVPTPKIFRVDVKSAVIIMEFIEGKQVKAVLDSLSKESREDLCGKIGQMIGRLHGSGVIHGDLTTSNMILDSEGRIVMVDFGLGEKTTELEAKGVDLHLMKRALQSTHYEFADESFENIIREYAKVLGKENAKKVLTKIAEIEKRGRYVAERKQESGN
jgi:TP53 regulating kinase-like protein